MYKDASALNSHSNASDTFHYGRGSPALVSISNCNACPRTAFAWDEWQQPQHTADSGSPVILLKAVLTVPANAWTVLSLQGKLPAFLFMHAGRLALKNWFPNKQ